MTAMIEQGDAPLVPEVAARRRENQGTECDRNEVREDIDAMRMEAPFVPLVSPVGRRDRRVGMPNTD